MKEQPVEEDDVYDTEAGMETDMEEKGVDFVIGVPDVRISGYEFEGFALSELNCRKRLARETVPEGVVGTSHNTQGLFSNL